MNEQDFIAFDETYFKEYEGWGEAPATVWDMGVWKDNEPCVVAQADSPYELMDALAVHGIAHGAVLAIRGWGAPIKDPDNVENETRPSQHPERMRIVMYLHIQNDNGVLTVALHPRDEELQVMSETGVGALADAINEAVDSVKQKIEELQELAADLSKEEQGATK